MAKGLFGRPKNAILVRDYGFFAAVLSYMVKDNVVTLEVKVFAGINTENVIKNTENFFSSLLGKVYCEIVIV